MSHGIRLARIGAISSAIMLAFVLALSFSEVPSAYADTPVDKPLTANAITVGASISDAKIKVEGPVYYTGKARKPKVAVSLDGTTLEAGTDYSVRYAKNTNIGKAEVTVTGKGRFTGQKTVNFKITKHPKGWFKVNGKLYYYKSDGFRAKGDWAKRNGYWTYLSKKTGAAVKGWFKVDKNWYYSNSKYQMQTGWKKLPVHWYKKSDGKWHTNTNKRLWYYFNSKGAMLKGWQQIGGNWYFLHRTDGDMASDTIVNIDGSWYSFKKSGALVVGPNWIKGKNGSWYYTSDSSGKFVKGWQQVDGKWYYFDAKTRKMFSNITVWIDGSRYHFNSDGAMHTGWLQNGPFWYFFAPNGKECMGWNRIDGQLYYFQKRGNDATMLHSGRYRIDGKLCRFDSNGHYIP